MSVTQNLILPKKFPKKKLKVIELSEDKNYWLIKNLIWFYFILLLFEGALRKWFLPGLSQGLLIVRDPVVVWIYIVCYSQGIFPSSNKYIVKVTQWTLLAVVLSIIINQAHPATIAYGARTNLLHFPLIFIMGRVLNRKDVINFGKAFLVLALPMTWIVAQQFQADRFDIMNVASGGTGHQMMTSGDKVRASGTFSFISGIVFYYCFAVAFIIHGFLNKSVYPKWMLYLGTGSTFLAMVTAGSRSVIAESLQVVACFAFLVYYKPKEFGRIGTSVMAISTIILILYSQIDLFKEGIGFLSLRFEEASNVEGNPIEAYLIRYWDIIVSPYYYSMWTGFFGNGLGTATRAGAALGGGYGGAELSWSRPIMENGFLIGILFLAWRVWITKNLFLLCLKGIKRENYLAIFIFGAAGPVLLFGILGQPTNLGFAAFGGGLCLAAAKTHMKPH
jgi:hypothetical protein